MTLTTQRSIAKALAFLALIFELGVFAQAAPDVVFSPEEQEVVQLQAASIRPCTRPLWARARARLLESPTTAKRAIS
jgi:hypothetical protein